MAATDRAATFLVHRATAPGVGGIASIELYGDHAEAALAQAFRSRRAGGLPRAGRARLGVLVDRGAGESDVDGEAVDDVIVARVEANASWCGLAGWTVTCHGGPAITDRVVDLFVRLGGERVTTAELLERAARAGAIDPVRQQAYPCLVEAYTERAARYFLRQWSGELGRRLLELAAGAAHDAVSGLDAMISGAPIAMRLATPLRVLIAGRTNAGKSTLFNTVLGRERVVVSTLPGTTRDLVTETIEIAGYPVTLIDSAGLRAEEADDPVEREGIRRALEAPRDAVLFLTESPVELAADELVFLSRLPGAGVIVVRTKHDLRVPAPGTPAGVESIAAPARDAVCSGEAVDVSAVTGFGVDRLRERIREAWLGPPETREIPPLPFTPDLVERVDRLREAWSARPDAGPDDRKRTLAERLPGLIPEGARRDSRRERD